MRWNLGFLPVFALAASFGLMSAASAETRAHHKTHHHGGTIGYLPPGASGLGPGYQELSGDPDGGVGFYPLPYQIRVGAWRYHAREAASAPPFIRNSVLYAMVMDRYRYDYWWATPANSWRYGVEDPFAGFGTPYFAGYYGPAEGDEEEPAFPFGRPYSHW